MQEVAVKRKVLSSLRWCQQSLNSLADSAFSGTFATSLLTGLLTSFSALEHLIITLAQGKKRSSAAVLGGAKDVDGVQHSELLFLLESLLSNIDGYWPKTRLLKFSYCYLPSNLV